MNAESITETPAALPPGFWRSLWNSATSFHFYPSIQDQSFGRSLRYLLALGVCISLLIGWRVDHDFNRSLSEWVSWISTNIPDIRIQNGIAVIPSGGARRIQDEKAILILDSSAAPKPIEEKFRTGMFLGRDKVLLKWNQAAGAYSDATRLEQFIMAICYFAYVTEPQAFHGDQIDLAAIPSLVINADSIKRWKGWARRWVGISLPFLCGVFYLAGKLLQALFFSVVLAYSYRSLRESGFNYQRSLNVCIYALTPQALFSAGVQILGLQIPHMQWVFLGMYVAFLMGAMGACLPPRVSGASHPQQDANPDHWVDF